MEWTKKKLVQVAICAAGLVVIAALVSLYAVNVNTKQESVDDFLDRAFGDLVQEDSGSTSRDFYNRQHSLDGNQDPGLLNLICKYCRNDPAWAAPQQWKVSCQNYTEPQHVGCKNSCCHCAEASWPMVKIYLPKPFSKVVPDGYLYFSTGPEFYEKYC